MANNKTSKKVFKIKKVLLIKGENITINKKQAFKLMTTKKLYSGEYSLIIQINGKEYGNTKFYITV
jgi:ribosomal protein S4E